jgi:hypothetical protein
MIFCIDLLLFYTSNIIKFISFLGGFIYWIVCLENLNINGHIQEAVKDLLECAFCEQFVDMLEFFKAKKSWMRVFTQIFCTKTIE